MFLRVFLCITLLWAASSFAEDTPKTIHIATESWENYTNEDGTGVFFDIVKAVYEPVGIQLKVEFVPYARALGLIKAKQADAMFGTYSTEEEGKDYLFTPNHPIDAEHTVVYFDKTRVTTWQDLTSISDFHAAWVRGYDYQDALSVKPRQITEVVDTNQGLSMLSEGRFDIYMNPKLELLNSLEKAKFDTTPYRMETIMVKHLYMALSKTQKSRQLAKIYDERFPKLLAEGKITAFFKTYGRDIPFLQ